MVSKQKFLSDNVNGLKSSKKCLNTLGTKSLIAELYFHKKRILPRIHLTNGKMIFKGRYVFDKELQILVM